MRLGSKKIYHLEAWVIKVMTLYKVCFESTEHIIVLTESIKAFLL
jgi:hypothetical protein